MKRKVKPGDTIKLRGREPYGTAERVTAHGWLVVKWQSDKAGPQFVHVDEVEFI